MNTACLRGGLVLSLLLAGCCLVGCESGGHFRLGGYTTRPTFDDSISTIYVPIATNVSYRKEIEFDLTRAVIREIGKTPYRVTSDKSKADTELLMKVVNVRKNVILMNQQGETRDVEQSIIIEVVWRNLRTGDVLTNPKRFDPNELPLPGEPRAVPPEPIPILVTPTGTYIPELGGSMTSAEKHAIDRAARQIVNMMEVWR